MCQYHVCEYVCILFWMNDTVNGISNTTVVGKGNEDFLE